MCYPTRILNFDQLSIYRQCSVNKYVYFRLLKLNIDLKKKATSWVAFVVSYRGLSRVVLDY